MRVVRPIALALALLAASGCTRHHPPELAGEPQGTRYLHFNNLGEPEFLDPGLLQGNIEFNVALALFEGLIEYDPQDLHPVPAIAARWEVSQDGRVYTFHLRPTARWSDGLPVTAEDFVYSWTRVLDPRTGSKYAHALFYVKNGLPFNSGQITDPTQLGLRAVDAHTLRVTLEHPTPFFLSFIGYATFRPVPRRAVEQYGTQWTRPEHIITNGPFLLKVWIPHKEILVVKNPGYWDVAHVQAPGVRFYPIEDRETALKMFESGQLDVDWELPPLKIPSLRGHPNFQEWPLLSTYFYRLNVSKPPLNDVRVRRALAMAIDRTALCEQYLRQTEVPSASIVPQGFTGYTPAPGLEFNPAEAKRLLAEAGYADPRTFPPITILYNTDALHRVTAEVIQHMWQAHLGINVQLLNEEWKSYLKDLETLNYQVARSAWSADYPDPNTFLDMFASASRQNQTGWANGDFDRLIAAAAREPNATHRLRVLREAETLLLQEAVIIPLWTYKKQALVREYVRGFYPNLLDIHPFKWMFVEGGGGLTPPPPAR